MKQKLRAVAAALAAIELTAAALTHWHRRSFPWLITRADASPVLRSDAVRVHRSFDPELGWCRVPGEGGTERTEHGLSSYSVDERGRRTNPAHPRSYSAPIACFGDSFTFCRLVDDDQTWPYHLSELTGTNVANYGVGNYGLDQALLRFERELPTLDAHVVMIGVVPETIARIQSAWKHYFEYGNTLAFKPRFEHKDGRLILHPSVIRESRDFLDYHRHLAHVRAIDGFYHRKFRRDLLGFPYSLRLAGRARRHLPILFHLTVGRLRGQPEAGFSRAFEVIVRENHALAARLYSEAASTALLEALIIRFVTTCTSAGKQPLLVLIPQPGDLTDTQAAHERFYAEIEAWLPVVDLTAVFRAEPDRAGLYTRGRLGPHPSDRANRLIAATIAHRLASLAPESS
ncbi:hypothetical protein IU469_32320 [Nocardia puris]|uniref:hypothetical protein n=1 Tax=Nocardia puris TaxID=208602 RepID=UPI0018937BC8|nr:hypothetical protein [Nocardia puris]MBF6370353.1 hypothetical protein [Nocardia puris]